MLVPDGGGAGIALIEQLALQRDEMPVQRAECAGALLARAIREARALQQCRVVVPFLPPLLQVEGVQWLQDAGFTSEDKSRGKAWGMPGSMQIQL